MTQAMTETGTGPTSFVAYSRFAALEERIETFVDGLPARMSDDKRARTASGMPWAMIASIPLWIVALVIGVGAAALGAFVGSFWGLFHLAVTLGLVTLSACAIPGLFKRSRAGWSFAFYEALLFAASSLIALSIPGILGAAAFGWVLFQVKYAYR